MNVKRNVKRRVILGAAFAALVAGPFVVRSLRKPEILEWRIPSEMSSSGSVLMAEASFSPLVLPNSNDINHNSIAACLSTDKDVILVSYSYGNDSKSRLVCGSLSRRGVIGNFETLLNIERPLSVIASIGCSGVKNGRVSFVLRQGDPEGDERSLCRELFCFAHLKMSHSGVFSLPEDEIDVAPSGQSIFKRAIFSRMDFDPHCWAGGASSLFFGGQQGIERFCPAEIEFRAAYTRKVIFAFAKSGESLNRVPDPQVICSNIGENGDTTLNFVIAPLSAINSFHSQEQIEHFGKNADRGSIDLGLFTGDGNKTVIDLEGNVLSQIPFPTLPFNQQAKLTRTHWCFVHSFTGKSLFSAPLNDPNNYTTFIFPDDQISIPEKEIGLTYKIHAVLPDGQSLLCSRNVGTAFVERAKREGIPLSELGIAKLSRSIG